MVALDEPRLYVVGNDGFSIVDVSTPDQPSLSGKVSGLGDGIAVGARGDLVVAFVQTGGPHAVAVDATDPTTPVVKTGIPLLEVTYLNSLQRLGTSFEAISGVPTDSDFVAVDAADATGSIGVRQFAVTGRGTTIDQGGVWLAGSWAFASGSRNDGSSPVVAVFDPASATSNADLQSVPSPDSRRDLVDFAAAGDAFVADDGDSLFAFSVGSDHSPLLESALRLTDDGSVVSLRVAGTTGIALTGRPVYGPAETYCDGIPAPYATALFGLDLSDPVHPKASPSTPLTLAPSMAALSDKLLLLAAADPSGDGTNVAFVNLSTVLAPSVSNPLHVDATVRDVRIEPDFGLGLLAEGTRLELVDVSGDAPVLRGSVPLTGGFVEAYSLKARLVIVDTAEVLSIDVSNPDAPKVIARVAL